MTGKTHQLIGFTSVYSLALALNQVDMNMQTFLVCFMLISLGSLTPDLDNEKNKIYTLVPIGHKTFSEIFERVFGKHRSISHSFLGIAILGFLIYQLFSRIPEANGLNTGYMWWAMMIGIVAHIGADMYTKDGVPLLWPLKISFYGIPVKGLRVRTGSWVEFVVVTSGAFLVIAFMTYAFWERVVRLFTF